MLKNLKYLLCASFFFTPIIVASHAVADQLSCEEAREKLIAPLREAKIAECKSDPKNKPDECERYFSTYGDATARPGGGVNPRMFDNIPECQQDGKK